MAPLLNAHKITKSFSMGPLFSEISFGIEAGDRIGLIGPNGAGKSTLLKILAGVETVDKGTVSRQSGLRVAYLAQTPTVKPEQTLLEMALEGASDPHDWEFIARAHEWISKLQFEEAGIDAETKVGDLSGGWRKRAALMRELMRQPDLLLLDEPTNHLDVESILWLEEFFAQSRMAILTITHDRQFLQRVSTKIFELDKKNPDGLLVVQGNYSDYLIIKEQNFSAQQRLETKLKNTLRRETEWLLQGAKARTTKQQARIDRAYDLGDEVAAVSDRNALRNVDLAFQGVSGGPKKLIEAKKISKTYPGRELFKNLDLIVSSKTRLGLMGRNGCGKSTIIRILLGEEQPDSGTVDRADHLKVAYFQQNRDELDPKLTVLKTICPQGEYVSFGGKFVHVHGYLERFLFRNDRIQTLVGKLSGGEQSRLLLAKLMLTEANLLVLDEPTNDLDLATLHVLEEALDEFAGGLILVTHDRYFMDRLCTEIWTFDQGDVQRFASVGQWEDWHKTRDSQPPQKTSGIRSDAVASVSIEAPAKTKKLSYKDQRDLDTIEERIHQNERELEVLTLRAQAPEIQSNSIKLTELSAQMAAQQTQIDALYKRWDELLSLQSSD